MTPKRSGPVTLKMLADKLGLHVSTVSRVLNGDPERVHEAASAKVISRIQTLAQQLHYAPNTAAVNLKTQQTREIAVIMPSVSDLVMSTAYEGVAAAAFERGYTAFVATSGDDPRRQLEFVRLALRRQVAGMLLSDVHARGKQPGIDLLRDAGTPFAYFYRRRGDTPTVVGDDVYGGQIVAEHFYELGHRKVGMLAGGKLASSVMGRARGFVKYFESKGIEIPPSAILHGAIDAASGREQGSALLNAHPELTAVFAVNDFLAIGLMGAAREARRRIGQDFAVVGYNDTPLAANLPVPLTSVAMPLFEIGRIAAQNLIALIEGRTIETVVFRPQLFVRESSRVSLRNSVREPAREDASP